MRTIIAGSRSCDSTTDVYDAVELSGIKPSVVLSGGARGADYHGELWALGQSVPLEVYSAKWDEHGRGAGFKRNALMASKAEALIALWDGQSRGTKHMIDLAKAMKLKVFVYNIGEIE